MRRRKIFICVFAVSVLINIIPLLIFKDKAAVSHYAWFTIIIMLGISINGVVSFFVRHKVNYLSAASHRRFILTISLDEQDYTYTEEYEKEFFWQFCVYWFAVPFYIPCIFFTSGRWESILWPAFVMLAPQLVYFTYDISKAIKDEKEYKVRKQKQEQELKEQKLREELGHFK